MLQVNGEERSVVTNRPHSFFGPNCLSTFPVISLFFLVSLLFSFSLFLSIPVAYQQLFGCFIFAFTNCCYFLRQHQQIYKHYGCEYFRVKYSLGSALALRRKSDHMSSACLLPAHVLPATMERSWVGLLLLALCLLLTVSRLIDQATFVIYRLLMDFQ